ncbi:MULTISPECIES: DUF7262 family protein [Halobacterium]|uniref:DUF7262 family protein n=1 Tax=Halobacterium TaxID=2239 RepID=UPI001965E771|nr:MULTISPECIES: hypothetical protein [Halobacterium]MCF2166118.1 hypothetical protein [Halobacterium salinarum]MCF2166788.1 hypothetical protein [Halobacterium salinarum]MCF2239671.1 hypothetical protein [Halobacterium salinarum]QRY22872.1 hypothetical protein JT689_02265 [Halobacterium sp. GSL-19]WJK64168.1 hypothetical protein QSJ49_03220 [Halobacterium salinarum]
MPERGRRGQASLPAVEAAIGVLVILAVAATFTVGVPGDGGHTRTAQLDRYAADAATIIETTPPHESGSRIDDRLRRLLPASVLFSVDTTSGRLGRQPPRTAPTGRATVHRANGTVTLRVWDA